VAWITELKNVLSGFFYLLALQAYLRFRPLTDRETAWAWGWRYYPLVLVVFLCALLSKTTTCSLPAVLLLLVWWKAGRIERRDILTLAPLFILGVAGGVMTSWMEKHYAGVSGTGWSLSFVQRCLVAGRALWFYARKLFWPRNLTFIYPRWEIDASVAWQYFFPLAAVVVLIALWLLRSRIGRGPLVAVLCFGGTLVPALGFFAVYPFRYSYVADHFQYLASIALISLVVSALTAICKRAGQWGRDLGTLAATIVLLILGVCTWGQARIYQDFETLWGDTLTKNPQCWMAHLMLGNAFLREGKLTDAVSHYEQALRIKPDYPEAHANLGFALLQMGQVQQAIQQYEQALRIKPDYVEAHNAVGSILFQLGRHPEAMDQWEQALRIKPNDAAAHSNLGTALLQQGQLPEALAHFEQALRINPDLADAHYNLGLALEKLGRTPEAIEHYRQALQLRPDFAPARDALTRIGPGQ
jgi:tetratricopeptide (TPR) repeat protein